MALAPLLAQALPRQTAIQDNFIIRCRAAPLASIRQMSGQVSRGSVGEYQADDQALF